MDALSFTEADKQKFVEFLNIIAKCATFEMKTDEVITYFKLIAHMQQVMLPKLDANILEVVRIGKAQEVEKKSEPKAAKTKT